MAHSTATNETAGDLFAHAGVKIDEAIALAELIAQVGPLPEDEIKYLKTTAWVICDLLRDADAALQKSCEAPAESAQ